MVWLRGTWSRWVVVATALFSVSCTAAIGAGASLVLVGAGVVAFTCYDRVSVTVTDRLTGTKLCDAKVTFVAGSSETVATSCGQAALSAGKYVMRVERPGLVPFTEPVEVAKSQDCGQTIQTMFVALDRPKTVQTPARVVPPASAPPAVAPPASVPPPVVAPPASVPPAVAPSPSVPPGVAPSPSVPPGVAPPASVPSGAAPPASAPPAVVPSPPVSSSSAAPRVPAPRVPAPGGTGPKGAFPAP
jgi:hypothetical protein